MQPECAPTTPAAPTERHVVICDTRGKPVRRGTLDEAHNPPGELHLAFSVYLFSPDRRALLIQQRSRTKRLWPSVWANTCCSHPQWGEDTILSARRRLHEELGIDALLSQGPSFVYRAEEPSGRGVEHEFDILLHGVFEGILRPNPLEVAEVRWVIVDDLIDSLIRRPQQFAPWLHLGLPRLLQHLQSRDTATTGDHSPRGGPFMRGFLE